MTNTVASSGLSTVASLLAFAAVVSIFRFRKKVKLIRSLSSNRDFDVYVPYNMLFYGASHLAMYTHRWQVGMAFPYDENSETVCRELRNSWVISLMTIMLICFASGLGFLAIIMHLN